MVTEDAQHLVNYHAVKPASPELCIQFEAIVEEMKSAFVGGYTNNRPGDQLELRSCRWLVDTGV